METVQKTTQKTVNTVSCQRLKQIEQAPTSSSISIYCYCGTLQLQGRSGWFVLHLHLMIFSQQFSWGKIWADSSYTHSPSGESFYVEVWLPSIQTAAIFPQPVLFKIFSCWGMEKKNCCGIRSISSLSVAGDLFFLVSYFYFFSLLMTESVCMMPSRPHHPVDMNRLM